MDDVIRIFRALLAGLLAAGTLTLLPSSAPADPLDSATFAADASGESARVTTSLLGATLTGVRVAAGRSDATGSGSSASTANLGADVAGLGVSTAYTSQSAPPTQAAAATGGLGAFGVGPALSVGALTGSSRAQYPVGGRCTADGLLSRAVSSTAGLSVGSLLSTGTLTTTSTTELVAGSGTLNRGLRSTAVANTLSASALGVSVGVAGTPTLSVDAGGTATFTPGTVTVNGTVLTPGSSRSVTVGLGTVEVTAAANNTVQRTTTGGSVDVVTVKVTPLAGAGAEVALAPLRVSAQAPTGGLDCTPDAPTITAPANGSTTGDATPTVTGTGTPGAAVTLRDGSTTLSSAITVDADGTWSYTPTTDLADGAHTLTATQSVNGAASAAASTTFTVDVAAPAAPVVQAPADGTITRQTTFAVSGTGEAGARLVVTDGTTTSPTVTVGSDGRWSTTIGPLAEGTHRLVARQSDAVGNTSVDSAPVGVRVDTTAPATPVVSDPDDGATRTTSTVRVSGTGESGARLVLRADDVDQDPVTVDDDGRWSVELTDLADGDHRVDAVQTDAAGNVSPRSTSVGFRVDTRDLTAPAAPTISRPADRSLTDDRTPTVGGLGEPGARVSVREDGRELCTALVAGDSSWSCDVTPALGDGPHVLTAVQTDEAGNTSSASTAVRLVVDTTAPAAPTVTTPAEGTVTSTRAVPVSGTGEPGARLVLREGSTELCRTTVDAQGDWSCTTTNLADGSHGLVATQTDEAGNASAGSTVRTVVVDATAPAAPAITAPAAGARTADATPTVQGTGEPGARVTVSTGGRDVCSATVGTDGRWSCDVSPALADGTHELAATQTDPVGNRSPATTRSIVVDTTAPSAPAISAPADGFVTGFRDVTVTGTGEPGSSLVLRVDGTARPAVTVGADGAWSVPLTNLADGTHPLSAVQTDTVGNASTASGVRSFRVDTRRPGAPTITYPTSGTSTTDQRPEVRGTGQPGARVTVWDAGSQVCTATVTASGTWSCTPTRTLTDGGHNLTATQATAGGGSDGSRVVALRVVPPAVPTLTASGATILTQGTSAPVTISGTATPGGRVTVRSSSGAVLGYASVPANGRWSLRTAALRAGSYRVTASQVVRGRTSAASSARSFRVVSLRVRIFKGVNPTKARRPLIRGTGTPGARVTVRTTRGRVLGTTTVRSSGRWSLRSARLKKGRYSIRATQTYQRATSVSNTVTFRARPRR